MVDWLTDWVVVLHPTRQKIGHFGDVSPSQSLALIWKKLNPTQQKHAFTNQKKCTATQTHTRTHAHLFNHFFRDYPIWILLKQETVSGSVISWAICKSAPCCRQITMPVPHHSVFYRPAALPAAQPTASKHWRPKTTTQNKHKKLKPGFSHLLQHLAWKRSRSILKGKDK